MELDRLDKETLATEENSRKSILLYTFHGIAAIGLVCNSGTQLRAETRMGTKNSEIQFE